MKKLLIIIILTSILTGCSNNFESYTIKYNGEKYHVNETSNYWPLLFKSEIKINKITSITLNNESINRYGIEYKFIIEKDEKGNPLKINDMYVYGIVFDLKNINKKTSFGELEIITDKGEKINLNPNILFEKIESSESPAIVPLETPITYNTEVLLPLKLRLSEGVIITSIEFVSDIVKTKRILFNSIQYNVDEIKKNDSDTDVYLEFELEPLYKYVDDNYFHRGFVKVEYEFKGEKYIFNSDVIDFGSLLGMLIEVNE